MYRSFNVVSMGVGPDEVGRVMAMADSVMWTPGRPIGNGEGKPRFRSLVTYHIRSYGMMAGKASGMF